MQPSALADTAPTRGVSRWIVVSFALVGALAGIAIFSFMAPTYEAQTVVNVSNPAGSISDEIAVLQSPAVLDVAEALVGFRPEVSVIATEVTGVLTITATEGDPQDAAAAANAVADTYVQAQLGAAASIDQPAEPPSGRTGIGRSAFAAIGVLIGAMVGFFVSSIQRSQTGGAKPGVAASHDAANLPSAALDPVLDPVPDQIVDLPVPFDDLAPHHQRGVAPTSSVVASASAPKPSLWSSVSAPASPTPKPASSTPTTPPPAPASLSTTTGSMTSSPSSFSDAAKSDTSHEPAWLGDLPALTNQTQLNNLGRRALQSQHEAERYELVLGHAQEIAHVTAEHERGTVELRNEVAALAKKVRLQETRLKSRSGSDQTRVGDLEAQVDALEAELATLRQTLESERITHARRITEERGAADRALDNARREYRDELGKHVHSHRQTVADYRADLDAELAEDRARHAAALHEEHADYERQLESERARAEARIVAANEQKAREVATLRKAHRQELDRQAAQHKVTITDLRSTTDSNDDKLQDLQKENGMLRVEVSTQQKRAYQSETEQAAVERRSVEELALLTAELDGERERNTALRADVLRRSAEAHQAIDKAVEERTAQLAELEASVARQREYADSRVREISTASEEQARQAASREANLTAVISRLNREVEEAKRQQ